MKRFDPQVGRVGRGMSASVSHRSLKRLLRNASAISLFATGVVHQVQTLEAAAYTLTSANNYTYTENFDGIASGLTTGWSVYSGATASSLGTVATPVLTATAWSITTGQFKNVAAIDTVASTATTTVQNAATDRALGLQVTSAFGDPGAAFAFNFNATGMKFSGNSTALSFKMLMDSVQARSQVYTIAYATGASPTSFTTLGTWSDPGVAGSTSFAFTGDQLSTLSDQPSAWIRIISGTSSGTGSRDGVALDDFSLTYAASLVTGNYWVGGNTSWSSTSTNFSATSGGSSGAAQATTGALVFDSSSGFTVNPAITINDTVKVEAGLTFDVDVVLISPGTGTPLLNFNGASAAINTITVNSSYTTSLSVKLTGSNGLTKSGNGKLVLSGDNSGLLGAVTLSAGTLRASGANALGAGTLALTGGTLELASNLGASFNRDTTVSSDITIKSDRAAADNGAGSNQTLGALSIGAQTLTIDKGGNVGTGTAGITFGAVTATGAPTFLVNSGSTLTLASVSGAGQNLTFNGAGDATVSGAIATTSGSITKSGNGILTLSGANTFTGGVTINAGTVTLGHTSALNSTAGSENAIVFGSGSTGILSLNSNNATVASLNTNATPGTTFVKNGGASNATLTIGNSTNADSTYAGVIQNGSTGTLALNKSGNGTLTLTNANTYTGGTSITKGKIILNGGSLAAGTVSVANGATLATSGVASAGSLSLVTGATVDLTSAALTLSGGLTATGGTINYTLGNKLLTSGVLSLSGAVDITLAGTFNEGTYDLVTFASGDASLFNITTTRAGWTLTPNVTSTKYSVTLVIASANLNWNLSSDGTWDTTTAANWYNNSLTTTQAFKAGDNVTFDKSTGGVISISGTVNPASVTVNSAGDYTFQSGSISGEGGITKSGNGKLILSAANSFNGEVVVNAGTLSVTHANALGATSTGTRVISGATLDISNNIILAAEPLTLVGTGVGGVGALTTSQGGTNTVSGPITLSGNTLITSQGISEVDILTLSGTLTGSGVTLSVGGAADTLISGNISGSGLALNKTGNGILTLSGTSNSYTGGTTVSGGKLIATTANLTGNITDNSIFQIDQATTGSFAGNISGSGELIKDGTGAVTLSGTNTVSTITLKNGSLVMDSSSALPSTGTVAVTGGSTLNLSKTGTYGANTQTITLSPTNATNSVALTIGSGNSITLSSNLVISSESQIAVPGATGSLTLAGVISGSGKLVKTDLGKLIISGTNNNFAARTEIQGGMLTVNAGSSLGTGSLTLNAQGSSVTLELNESATVSSLMSGVAASANNLLTIASGKTLTVNESSNVTFGTSVGSNTFTISGAGGLTMSGSGQLTLDGSNTYTGLTSVTSGTLVANKAASISSSVSVSNGATLSLQDNQTLIGISGSGQITVADGKTFTINNSSNQTFGGSFNAGGSSTFTKSGSGTLNLSGASSQLSRDVNVSAGTVKVSNNNALGSGNVNISAGNLYASAGNTLSNNITIGSVASSGWSSTQAAAGWDFSTTTTTTATGPLAATTVANGLTAGSLTKGSGLTTTTGTAQHFGPFTNWSSSASGTATDLAYAVANNKYIGFSITAGSSAMALTDIMAYNIRRSNTGATSVTWQFSTDNVNFSTIAAQATATNSSGGNSMAAIDLTSVYTLQNINANSTVYFRLYGYNSTGSGGTFYLKDLGNTTGLDFGVNGKLYVSTPASGSGTLGIDEAGTATFTGNVVNNNTATLTAATGGTAIFKTGVISGTGSFTKTGNGTVELQGVNTFTGSLTLSAGNLKVSTLGAGGSASPLGAAADVPTSIIFNGGKLEYAGSGETFTRDFTVGNDGAGFISSGTGALVIGQDAQMDFDNAAASNRTLSLGGTTDIAVENIFNPSKFDAADINNFFTKLVKQDVNKWVVLGAGAGFVDDAATEMNIDGGELDFAMGSLGSATNKAHINVGSATLGWYNGNADDLSGRIYLNNAATAAFNIPSGTVTLANAMNNGASTTASLTKLGAGTLELGGTNNFSGGLTVSAGTVKATAVGAVGSGAVSVSQNATFVVNAVLANKITISTGGTLAGNGSDEDATIEEGGVLSPNGDNVGTIAFNKLTLNGGSHVKWQLRDATGAAGAGYDTLVVSVINFNNASSSKKIHVDVTSAGSLLHFDKTKVNKFELAKLSTALANGVNVTDLFSIDASQFEIDNNLTNDHLVWSMQLSADRDVMYVTTMIPEPSTYGLGLSALALAVVAMRRRKKKSA